MRRLLIALAALAACTDVPLEPSLGEAAAPLDDKLALQGEICTLPPANEEYPVKVLFVIDTSYSQNVTDPANQRVQAVAQVIDRYQGNPAVRFAVLAFDSVITNITGGFVASPDLGAIRERLSLADRLTDYQGALGAAYTLLAEDMATTGAEERARTKYVVIFFSDGTPDPRCTDDGIPDLFAFCNYDREDWPDIFEVPAGLTEEEWLALYPEMEAGRDYNSDNQLVNKVQDIVELQETFAVAELRFHTGFLFDPNLGQAFIDAFGLDRDEGIRIMTLLADTGGGTFTEFTSGGEVSFLNISYSAVKQVFSMTNLFAVNGSSVPEATGTFADSDADGLSDQLEDELRTCGYPFVGTFCGAGGDPRDTDRDGWSDLFEHRKRQSGFDPLDPTQPAQPCVEPGDLDGDGLRDCEERVLGTIRQVFDSDFDRLPDGIEFRAGLDPLNREDALLDDDADGVLNFEEVLRHWAPKEKEPITEVPPQHRYDVEQLGDTPDGRKCYRYSIENISLRETRGRTARERGANKVFVYFFEGAPDDPRSPGTGRVACVNATWIEPDVKLPATGRYELCPEDFVALGVDPVCVGPGERPGTGPGWKCGDPVEPEPAPE